MKPKNYAVGDINNINFAVDQCDLGLLLVAKSQIGIRAIFLGDDANILVKYLQSRLPEANLIPGQGDFQPIIASVIDFVEAPRWGLNLPLDIRGTHFQQLVWQALRKIPTGSTASYTNIAQCIGLPKSTRAVAQACSANLLGVAIPCHRVVRRDGTLSGYRWGVERKRMLLEREGLLFPAQPH